MKQEAAIIEKKEPSTFIKGAKDTFPVVASGIFDGIVYAFIARQMGLSWWETVALSLLVNGASSQFAALGMIKQGIFGWPVIISTLLINSRHIIYGLSIGPYLKDTKLGKLMLAAMSLSDETFGVTIHRFRKSGGDIQYFLGSAWLDYTLWQVSVMVGATIGIFSFNTFPFGLDFAFIATFIALLVLQINSRSAMLCCLLVAVVSTFVQMKWGPVWAIFAGTLVSVVYGGWTDE